MSHSSTLRLAGAMSGVLNRPRVLQKRKWKASTIRPRRSVLYMPGSNARAIEKARTLAGRRRDPRPGGRGRARRQGGGARSGGRRSRPAASGARGVRPHQRPRHAVVAPTTSRRRPPRARRHPGAEGLARRAARDDRPAAARHAPDQRIAGLGDDRDAARDPQRAAIARSRTPERGSPAS